MPESYTSMQSKDLHFVGGLNPNLVMVVSRKVGPKDIRCREGTRYSSVIGSIYYRHVDKLAEECSRRRSTKRRLPALMLAILLAPALPVLAEMASPLMMIAMTCGRPLEDQKRQNFD